MRGTRAVNGADTASAVGTAGTAGVPGRGLGSGRPVPGAAGHASSAAGHAPGG